MAPRTKAVTNSLEYSRNERFGLALIAAKTVGHIAYEYLSFTRILPGLKCLKQAGGIDSEHFTDCLKVE
jgi:hypothetical protein